MSVASRTDMGAPKAGAAAQVRGGETNVCSKRERGGAGEGDLAAMAAGNWKQQEDGSPSKKTRLLSPPASPYLPPSAVPDICRVSPTRSSPMQSSVPPSPVRDLGDLSPAVTIGGGRGGGWGWGGVAHADAIDTWGLSLKGYGIEDAAVRLKEEDESAPVGFAASRAILDL